MADVGSWTIRPPKRELLRSGGLRVALAWILFVAFALRLFQIEQNPPELFEDELSGAASAWSIVTTGHDVAATHLPFLVTRLELKQPIYGYATVPFQALLGHTVRAVRIPAILLGVLTTWLMFWLARVLGRRPWEAAVAAGLFAIVPWAVHYGRIGWEPSSVLPFTIAGVGLLWDGLARHRPLRTIAAAALLAFGSYAYQPALLIHVALAALVIAVVWRHLRRSDVRDVLVGGIVAATLMTPYLLALSDPLFTRRTVTISVFRDGLTPNALTTAWNHYWAQWDPRYLFFEGTANLRNEPAMGMLLPVLLPCLVVGLITLLRRRSAADKFLIGWLIIGPIAAAVTDDGVPHFARGIFALPPIIMACGRGADTVWRFVSRAARRRAIRTAITLGVATVFLVGTASTYSFYFVDYPRVSAASWRVGTAAAMGLLREAMPQGGVACIDPAATSYWTFPQFVAWYLPSPAFSVVEGVDDARCSEAGTVILGRSDTKVSPAASAIGNVTDAEATIQFVIWRVRPS